MPETPEQLEELFSWRLAAIISAVLTRYYDARMSGSSYESEYGDVPRPQAKLQEVPTTSYHNTTLVSCDTHKANKLTENGNENSKRKDLILKVLKTEDLLTLINEKRKKPYPIQSNTSDYTPRSMIFEEDGARLISGRHLPI